MKAVAYVSGISSLVLGSDLARQRSRIDTYAKANGIEIVQQFADIDGPFDSADRPAWQEALDYCRVHIVQTILIDFYERIATDVLAILTMLQTCESAGLTITDCSLKTNLTGTTHPEAKFAHQSMFGVSHLHRQIAAQDAEVHP